MDELVRQALAKWPDVPDCIGWLALDARGRWCIGEAQDGPRERITHAATIGFINRNYAAVGRCWAFQNGPQRVFVDLEYTPFVWRLMPRDGVGWDLVAHTGVVASPTAFWLDDDGRFLAKARAESGEARIGVVHDHDTALVTELLRDGDGAALDDETLTRLSSATSVATDTVTSTTLHWQTSTAMLTLPVQRIATAQVAACFGFDPMPSATMRVDTDTRR
jgi:hypothetical protein